MAYLKRNLPVLRAASAVLYDIEQTQGISENFFSNDGDMCRLVPVDKQRKYGLHPFTYTLLRYLSHRLQQAECRMIDERTAPYKRPMVDVEWHKKLTRVFNTTLNTVMLQYVVELTDDMVVAAGEREGTAAIELNIHPAVARAVSVTSKAEDGVSDLVKDNNFSHLFTLHQKLLMKHLIDNITDTQTLRPAHNKWGRGVFTDVDSIANIQIAQRDVVLNSNMQQDDVHVKFQQLRTLRAKLRRADQCVDVLTDINREATHAFRGGSRAHPVNAGLFTMAQSMTRKDGLPSKPNIMSLYEHDSAQAMLFMNVCLDVDAAVNMVPVRADKLEPVAERPYLVTDKYGWRARARTHVMDELLPSYRTTKFNKRHAPAVIMPAVFRPIKSRQLSRVTDYGGLIVSSHPYAGGKGSIGGSSAYARGNTTSKDPIPCECYVPSMFYGGRGLQIVSHSSDEDLHTVEDAAVKDSFMDEGEPTGIPFLVRENFMTGTDHKGKTIPVRIKTQSRAEQTYGDKTVTIWPCQYIVHKDQDIELKHGYLGWYNGVAVCKSSRAKAVRSAITRFDSVNLNEMTAMQEALSDSKAPPWHVFQTVRNPNEQWGNRMQPASHNSQRILADPAPALACWPSRLRSQAQAKLNANLFNDPKYKDVREELKLQALTAPVKRAASTARQLNDVLKPTAAEKQQASASFDIDALDDDSALDDILNNL